MEKSIGDRPESSPVTTEIEWVADPAAPGIKISTIPRLPLLILVTGSGCALIGAIYLLTRPCVIGPCQLLQTAQATGQQSNQALQSATSKPEILTIQDQLRQAARQLQTIPTWSGQRQTAQILAQTYEAQAAALDPVLAAQDQAAIALQQSLNPPHSAQEWTQIQQLWQGAIAQLKQIPRSSSAYPLAQRKIAEYQKHAALTQRRLTLEQRATQTLRQARATAQLAETRQGIAQNLEGWQKAQASWQVAVNLLQKIPANTTAATNVEELTTTYQAKLIAARNHSTQEQVAVSSYNQAQRLAKQAKGLEQRQQWSQAVSTWRNALAYLQQVPAETFYAKPAQTLTTTYNNDLQQAQQNLQAASLLQKAQADLNKTCAGSPKICTYSVNAGLLRVQLTQAYLQTLLETTTLARRTANTQAQTAIQQHLVTLQTALEAVSKNTGLPIEIYAPNGALMTKYDPSR